MKDGEDKPIPPDPGIKRIPVRIDRFTSVRIAGSYHLVTVE